MALDVDPRNRLPERPTETDWNPQDRNPCRHCTPENCEWWGICPHTRSDESKEAER